LRRVFRAVVKRCLKFLAMASIAAHAATAGVSTSAAASNPAVGKFQMWRSEAIRILAAQPDANSLATAAALSFFDWSMQSRVNGLAPPPSPSAVQLAAKASELAPQNAGMIWLHLQLCAATPSCDNREVAIVLRWVEPENSVAWLTELADAQRDKDSVEVGRVLADMAHGSRFDLYVNQIVIMMFDALTRVRDQLSHGIATSELARLATFESIADNEIIPSFKPLVDACRDSSPGSERREDCLKIAKTMQRGDTIIVQLTCVSIEKHTLPPDSKEARILTERRHLLEWRMSAASQSDISMLPWTQKARTRSRLAEMRLRPREEDVSIALLRERNLALEPAENHR
jgi:hypothetical protein